MKGTKMIQVKMIDDGKTFNGATSTAVIDIMRRLQLFQVDKTNDEFITWFVDYTLEMKSETLNVTGATTEEKSASLIDELVDHGLATKTEI